MITGRWSHAACGAFAVLVGTAALALAQDTPSNTPNPGSVFRVQPPTASDTLFAGNPSGFEGSCLYRSGGPIVIEVPVTRHVGGWEQLRLKGLIDEMAVLMIAAYDVDVFEVDSVYLNGENIGDRLIGYNCEWKVAKFLVPTDWIHFPSIGNDGPPEPAINTITITIDQGSIQEDYCTTVDWAAIAVRAARPVVFVHGIVSEGDDWGSSNGNPWYAGLRAEFGVPIDKGLNMGWLDGISANAGKIAARVDQVKEMTGSSKVTLVTHSKGGIDSREYIRSHDDVENLTQIGTPNAGSFVADAVQHVAVSAFGFWATLALNVLAAPAGAQLTTMYMAAYNLWNGGLRRGIEYTSVAGAYNSECVRCPEIWLGLLTVQRPNDGLVSVASAHALGMQFQPMIPGRGNGTTEERNIYHGRQLQSRSIRDTLASARRFGTFGVSAMQSEQALPQFAVAVDTVLSEGDQAEFYVPIDDTSTTAFMVFYPGGDVDVTLTSPSSVSYTEASVEGNGSFGWGDYEFMDGRVEAAGVIGIEVGMWRVTVRADSVLGPEDEVPIRLMTLASSPAIQMQVEARPPFAAMGQAVQLVASPTNAGTPLLGADAKAVIVAPDGTRSLIQLRDDGVGADSAAGDGRYTAAIGGSVPAGRYRCSVTAAGGSGGSAPYYARSGYTSVTVGSSSAPALGSVTSAAADLNGNGLYDELVVDVDVTVSATGLYWLAGTLQAADGQKLVARRIRPFLRGRGTSDFVSRAKTSSDSSRTVRTNWWTCNSARGFQTMSCRLAVGRARTRRAGTPSGALSSRPCGSPEAASLLDSMSPQAERDSSTWTSASGSKHEWRWAAGGGDAWSTRAALRSGAWLRALEPSALEPSSSRCAFAGSAFAETASMDRIT